MKEYLNIIPTSAMTGEGMPDLIGMFIYLSQKFLSKKLEFKQEIQCTILEVKVLEKTGTTIGKKLNKLKKIKKFLNKFLK